MILYSSPIAAAAGKTKLTTPAPFVMYPVLGERVIGFIAEVTTVQVGPEEPVNEINIVFPDPDVVMEVPPNTFKTFAAGTAIPESVTNSVGTSGGNMESETFKIPA